MSNDRILHKWNKLQQGTISKVRMVIDTVNKIRRVIWIMREWIQARNDEGQLVWGGTEWRRDNKKTELNLLIYLLKVWEATSTGKPERIQTIC